MRLDRWLWCARFFKTRGLATAAVKGGHIQLNGERAKPARELKAGDWLEIVRERQVFRVEVLELPARRGPAKEAAMCYREDPDSQSRREAHQAELQLERKFLPETRGRPDPRTRRRMRELKQG